MKRKVLFNASLLALLAVALTFGVALAHTTVHAGNYKIEVGWLDEPAIIGQRNAVIVNVADSTDNTKTVDVSKLAVSVTYGGQTKALELQPLSENSTNQYIAPILPTIPGQYTVQLRGQIGADNTDVNLDVQPEEVAASDALAFPSVSANRGGGGFGLTTWLSGGALLVSLVALALGIVALRKPRS